MTHYLFVCVGGEKKKNLLSGLFEELAQKFSRRSGGGMLRE